ncbi:prolyl aminopeptidase [Joostella sp.]|uniref:prolyl aminopeptidase n=1 Tax=Joostella sp. TaxID=2231138 RepID=UPI003A92D14C
MKGLFKVSNIHELYYEIWGNPKGIPIIFLHGGPGMGFNHSDKNFFDCKKYRVLFFDQRGAARSKPYGCVNENTTNLLVDDINTLTEELNFKKFYVFGGSWGSTLALVYAIRNPSRVLGLLLRGIFLANKSAIKHYIGGGVEKFFPKVWERLISIVPIEKQGDVAGYYYKKMCYSESKTATKFAKEWAIYELSIYKIGLNEKNILDLVNSIPFKSLSKLEAHFISNECFLPENYILDNCYKIKDIPTFIVHGRYDMICPPIYAYQLHQKLKSSKLYILTAGHASSEPEIKKKLTKELESMVGTIIK